MNHTPPEAPKAWPITSITQDESPEQKARDAILTGLAEAIGRTLTLYVNPVGQVGTLPKALDPHGSTSDLGVRCRKAIEHLIDQFVKVARRSALTIPVGGWEGWQEAEADDLVDHKPAIVGYEYDDSDPAAYRIVCTRCPEDEPGRTAGTLGRSMDYAHGWLDKWADDHEANYHTPGFMERRDELLNAAREVVRILKTLRVSEVTFTDGQFLSATGFDVVASAFDRLGSAVTKYDEGPFQPTGPTS